jgi:glycosyltransferase involved in cell wall biosynthesis
MTYRDATVAVVVPAYNEEGFVGDVVEGVPDYVDRVYPVDDCSTDDTWAEMSTAASGINAARTPTDPYDEVVVPTRHEQNRGVGATITTGYRRALDDDVDVIATMDGDGQMDPAFLPDLLDPVVDGDVAYAKGDRLDGLDDVWGMSTWRLFGNYVLTGLTRVSSGYWRLRDPQNGYTVISTDALASLDLDGLYGRYGFRNDVLIHLNVAGYDVADVSHPARYGEETSGIRYPSFVPNLSWLLLQRFWWRLGRRARRDGDWGVLGAFLAGVVALCLPALSLTDSAADSGGPDDARPVAASRTDGGVERSERSRERSGQSRRQRRLTPVALAASALFFCLGFALDVSNRRGRVTRSDSERAD